MKDRDFELYQTVKGPVCVTTTAHRRILDALKKGERSFSEVVEATGKAKSTVSIHLNRMVDQGLVSAREDEEDARRRFFSLRAKPLLVASPDLVSEVPEPEHLDPQGLLVGLVGRLAESGLSAPPLFRQVGRSCGARAIGSKGATPEDSVETVAGYWSKWGLGDADADGPRIRISPAPWLKQPGMHPEELCIGLLEGALGADGATLTEPGEESFTVEVDDGTKV